MNANTCKFALIIMIIAVLSGCSTRGKIDLYDGSTAQRLVTYSINNLMTLLSEDDLQPFTDKSVYVRTHFIRPSPVLDYANARLRIELADRFQINMVNNLEDADHALDFFFTSLGTDKDTFGLSIPIFWVSTEGEQNNLDILAVNMYHGVSELYYYSEDTATGEITKHQRILDRSRADVFATPLFSFPIDDLDEDAFIE